MMMTLRCRKAEAADASASAALHHQLLPPGWCTAEFNTFFQMPQVVGWVAEQAGDVVGLLLIQHVLDEAEILTIGVARHCQRQGVAQKLMAEAEASLHAAGGAELHLEVRADNLPAQALYRSLGFEQVGMRAGYYRVGRERMDALLMRKVL